MTQSKNRRITVSVVLLLGGMIATGWTAEPELKADILYSKVISSIVTIKAEDSSRNKFIGTAFSVSTGKDLYVTAWHLVKNAITAKARFSNGDEYDVLGIIDYDEGSDIALIKINTKMRTNILLNKNMAKIGSKVYAIGTPKGLEFSISDGLLSQIQIINGKSVYQFTSPISQGSSGGPLLDISGKVIGVVTSQYKEGQNINFATPSVYVNKLINKSRNILLINFNTEIKADFQQINVSSDNYEKLFISRDFWKYINWKEFDKNSIVSWIKHSSERWSITDGEVSKLRKQKSKFFDIPVDISLLKQDWGKDHPYLMVISPDINQDSLKINGDRWRKILNHIEKELGPYTIKNDFSEPGDGDSNNFHIVNTRTQFDIGETRIQVQGLIIELDNKGVTNTIFITAGHNTLLKEDIQANIIKCYGVLTTEIDGNVYSNKKIDDIIYVIDEKSNIVYNTNMRSMNNININKSEVSFDFPKNKIDKFNTKVNVNRVTGQYKMSITSNDNDMRRSRGTVNGNCEKIESLKPKF